MACSTEIQVAFILSSFMTFFGGLIILLAFRLILKLSKKWQTFKGTGIILELFSLGRIERNPLRRLYFQRQFRNRIELLLSAQTVVGQVLVILVFVLSIGSLIIYFINSRDPVRKCSSHRDKTVPVDLSFNVFFAFYFGLRFWAAEDKIKFWIEMNSIVDIFTIPPTFISYYLKSNWLGLRFLRALRLLELPKILQILKIIKTSNSVKLSKLLSIVISTWFTAAGFLHLVENSGDPWLNGRNSQSMSYFEAIYLVTATMSTVGFGDVVAKTALGRTFIVFFTLGSLILFANCIPEMVELFTSRRKYTKPYEAVKGKKFIVVCGNITVDSVTAFLRNFLHHKSGEVNMDIVFLGEDFLYNFGSCPGTCSVDQVMALSIKNYYSHTRIIIEILQSHNKVFLSKIPAWNWSTGDNIICFAELKLGFIAQGCLVPGLCTFLTTLFIEQNQKVFPKYPWQKYFLNGLKNKILTQCLSNDFVGMTFPAVSRLCFVKMHLMLIAIQLKSQFNNCCSLILNPSAQVKLNKDTLGFFIAESQQAVKRAFFYCSTCHKDVYTPELIENCGCKNSQEQALGNYLLSLSLAYFLGVW
ncbi:Potassium channel subfamily U member 1 [Lemmus lemmus]